MSKKSVIIFDDDEDILSICSYILNNQGWAVHTFTDVVQVAERVGSIMPDIIIMDNWIPESGGIVATQTLKNSSLKNIPVIYFSANSQVQALCAQAGADSWLAKPFEMADLVRAVDHALTLK